MNTYKPDGTGHCKPCGRDVGKHDGGHKLDLDHLRGECRQCELPPEAAIHDVGRVLRCPSEITNLDRVTIYPEVHDAL